MSSKIAFFVHEGMFCISGDTNPEQRGPDDIDLNRYTLNESINKISLVCLNLKGNQALLNLLTCANVPSIEFYSCAFNPEELSAFTNGLNRNYSVKHLTLSTWNPNEVKSAIDKLRENRSIETLELAGNWADEHELARVVGLCISNQTIKHLLIDITTFNDNIPISIGDLIKNAPHLETLTIDDRSIFERKPPPTLAQIRTLVKAIINNMTSQKVRMKFRQTFTYEMVLKK